MNPRRRKEQACPRTRTRHRRTSRTIGTTLPIPHPPTRGRPRRRMSRARFPPRADRMAPPRRRRTSAWSAWRSWARTWPATWRAAKATRSPSTTAAGRRPTPCSPSIPRPSSSPRSTTRSSPPRCRSREPRSSWSRRAQGRMPSSTPSWTSSSPATSSSTAATRCSPTRSAARRRSARPASTSSARASPAARRGPCTVRRSCRAAPTSRGSRSARSSRASPRSPRASRASRTSGTTAPDTSSRWCTTASSTPTCSSSPRPTT